MMLRAFLLLALLGHAAALQPAVASTHARKVHRTPTVHALAGGRGAALATGLSLVVSQAASAAEAVAPWAYSTLLDEIDAKHVTSALLSNDGKQVLTIDTQGVRHESQAFDAVELINRMKAAKVQFELAPPEADLSGLVEIAISVVPPLLLLAGLFFLVQRGGLPGMGGGMGQQMQFGKSRSEINLEPDTGVTFADVAGCDGSKLELEEVVDFLKNPSKYSALGAKVPRGCLMEGPPGTGKTLLAKAVAGEAGVPFISASGSEFVEMFVGVGASRVRDLFGQAKKNAPCIVFIDEIDAVGRTRPGTAGGPSGGGGNDEREQTLNQILTEMDGFDGNSGVIVLAATNRGDILDPALLRAGRFDRRVPVDLPDRSGREQILKVHARGKPLADSVELANIASRTTGFSGASLQNLLNEAAIVAARRNKTAISYDEVDYAIDRLTVGMQKTSGTGSQKNKELTAYHEAGKAIMALVTPDYDTVSKVTIIPRSNGQGGFTLFTPSDERLESGMYTKSYLLGQLAVALGGRVSEELKYGIEDVTTAGSGDMQQVRSIARRMVAQWGFSVTDKGAEIGIVGWEADGAGKYEAITRSDATAWDIDQEVMAMCDDAYARCKAALTKHRGLVDMLVVKLLDVETVNAKELLAMLEAYDPVLAKELDKQPPIDSTTLLAPATGSMT